MNRTRLERSFDERGCYPIAELCRRNSFGRCCDQPTLGKAGEADGYRLDADKEKYAHKKFSCNARRRPREALSPTPDPALLNTEHENGTTPNDGSPFLLVQSAGDAGSDTLASSLDQLQGVRSRLHESIERDVRGARAGMCYAGCHSVKGSGGTHWEQ